MLERTLHDVLWSGAVRDPMLVGGLQHVLPARRDVQRRMLVGRLSSRLRGGSELHVRGLHRRRMHLHWRGLSALAQIIRGVIDMRSVQWLCVSLVLAALFGCGGNKPTGDLPVDGGTGSADTGPGSVTTLAGTWDITGSSAGSTSQQVSVTLDTNLLTITADRTTLTFSRLGSTWTVQVMGDSSTGSTTVDQQVAPLNSGAIPIALGGAWSLSPPDAGISCYGTFGTSIQSACTGVDFGSSSSNGICFRAPDASTSVCPDASASTAPHFTGNFTGRLVQAETSIFGDLGGQWDLVDTGGAHCTAELSGARATINCIGFGNDTFTFTVAFDGAMLSGTTVNGIEFSGIRR
jgi:hypothetical protein